MSRLRGGLVCCLVLLWLVALSSLGVPGFLRTGLTLLQTPATSVGKIRRLTGASPTVGLQRPGGGNLPDATASDSSISVVAGPAYTSLTIGATGGLGTGADARAKLVDSGATDCAAATAKTVAPLDGLGEPSVHTSTENTFSSVKFIIGGGFRICYKTNTGASWQLLPVMVNVSGASLVTTPHFCFASTSFPCRIQLRGTDLGAAYKVGLLPANGTCGNSILDTSSFSTTSSEVLVAESTTSVQVHSFGTKLNTDAATFVLCLCPNFDADGTAGACQSGSMADFVQTLGTLHITTITPSVTNVFTGLPFGLTVNCGDTVGGCAPSTGNRIKIADDSTANDLDAWNSTGGCGAAQQTPQQVSPANCQSNSACLHAPSTGSTLSPTWQGLVFEGRVVNQKRITMYFDVCYCDSNCFSASRWFKVGTLRVKPVVVQGPSIVNHPADIQLIGTMGPWTRSGSTSVREMKAVSDAHATVNRDDCYKVPQSTLFVSGHGCSSTRDCGSPTYNDFGQTYLNVTIKVPGWAAVCYCDSMCESRMQWFVYGRIETAGPISGQGWSFYTNMVFEMQVSGWHLSPDNRIRVISHTERCADALLSDSAVAGPSPTMPTQLAGSMGDLGSFKDLGDHTQIAFAKPHGLDVGARIDISGVTCASCTDEVSGMFNAEHEVKSVANTTLLLDLTFPEGEYPAVNATTGEWRRTDLQTYAGLVISSRGWYDVCWSASAMADKARSFMAGSLLVTDAPLMPARLYLSTIEPLRIAPIVITFTTSANKRYRDAAGPMQLRIDFVSPEKLEPAFHDGSPATTNVARDSLAEASQSTCGEFALELGTNSELGFPMPQGCYYRKQGDVWEFYMVFHKGNGLAPSKTYEIVMLAKVLAGLAGEVVKVWSLDDVVSKQHDILEIGRAHASKAAASILRQATDPAFDEATGVSLLGGAGGILELSGGAASFRVQLKAQPSTPIKHGNLIRFFMRPFTQWHVGSACSASCTPHSGSTCDSVLACFTESLMGDWKQKNVMKVILPSTMADITETVHHTVAFTALTTPLAGFFPTGWSAELQAFEGTKPHYVSISGNYVYVEPKLTAASIVTAPGDGNVRPFRGDRGNELYLKIVLGVTVFAATSGDATMTIGLPDGYSGIGITAAPDGLSVLGGQVPSGRGDLTAGAEEGTWAAALPSQYRFTFGACKALYAGSSVFLRISVDNPVVPLQQDLPSNMWTLQLSAKGLHDSPTTLPTHSFTASSGLAGSVSVLGKLTDDIIMPSNFAAGADRNWLSIFFRTEQDVLPGGSVWVEAPNSFDFGTQCEVQNLPASAYEDFDSAANDPANSTYTLPLPSGGTSACHGEKASQSALALNRAKISLTSGLSGWMRYGFRLRVANARSHYAEEGHRWRLWTYMPNGRLLDGCPSPVRVNADDPAGSTGSWGVYDHMVGPSQFQIVLVDRRPTGLATEITVFPLVFVADTELQVRITAPAGYTWSFTPTQFVYWMRNSSLSSGMYVWGAEADMPLSVMPRPPSAPPFNVLDIVNLTGRFRHLVKYGFRARIIVPSHTPTDSLNTFVLTVEGSTQRLQAGLAAAPPVQRVVDARAELTNYAISGDGTLTLRFRTVTPVHANGGLVAMGSAGFQALGTACKLSATASLPASALPPYSCTSTGLPSGVTLTLKCGGVLQAGTYKLSIDTTNPASPAAVSWNMTTYEDLNALSPLALDYEGTAVGLQIDTPMAGAALVTGGLCLQESISSCAVEDRQYQRTGRNDRPGERNNLIFSFSLSSNSTPGRFVIRAPTEFTWAAECNVIFASADVFGVFSELPSNYTEWPANATAKQCRGHNSVAAFDVDHLPGLGFIAARHYVFRVDWAVNPQYMPTENLWTLQFSNEASLPFAGFMLWSLRSSGLVPRDSMQGVENVASLHFSLHNTVPRQGYLHIQAPSGFLIPLQCQIQILSDVELPFPASDCRCEGLGALIGGVVKPTNTGRVHLLGRALNSGVPYVLQLSVTNPAAPTPLADSWSIRTYRKLTWIAEQDEYEALDVSMVQGFRIHPKLGTFRLDSMPTKNGLAEVSWEFSVQFQEQVYATDLIEFHAPSGYTLQDNGTSDCIQHSLFLGMFAENSTVCKGPCYREVTCANNSMSWQLRRCPTFSRLQFDPDALCFPENSMLRFKLSTQNPEITPSLNLFFLQHKDLDGNVLSSGTLRAYPIVPLLANITVEPHAFTASSTRSEAVGSKSTIRLNFTARTPALTVRISGSVGSSSFRFSATQAFDSNTGDALLVHERDTKHVVLSMRQAFPANSMVSITLTPMQNPERNGPSTWSITTYTTYNKVMGPLGIADERRDATGFRIVGYVAVLTSSSLDLKYYGSTGSSVRLAFRSSVPTPGGEEVLITAPKNYAFESRFVSCSGLQPVNVSVQSAPEVLAGTYTRGTDTADGPLFTQAGGARHLFWHRASRQWVISRHPGQVVSGLIGEAVLGVGGGQDSPRPSVTDLPRAWQVRSGSGWLPAPAMRVLMEGQLLLGGRQLVSRLSHDLPVEAEARVSATVSLPTTEQDDRKWLFEVRRAADGTLLATNDAHFLGFTLFWHVNFSVVPTLRAPQARSTLKLTFDQPRRIQGFTTPFPQSVRFELMAPMAFNFPFQCFSKAELRKPEADRLFDQCSGTKHVASMISTLVTQPSRVRGMELAIELIVDLPLVTPFVNEWTLNYFIEGSTVHSGHGTASGFAVVPMAVSFEGNNQMGTEGFGYFTFSSNSTIAAGWEIRITAPARQKYQITCWRLQPGNMPKAPICTKMPVDEAVALSIPDSGELRANQDYTLGIRIKNPGKFVPDSMNLWSLILRDPASNIQDADYAVKGEQLRALKIVAPEEISVIRQGQGTFTVTIAMTFAHDFSAGVLSHMRVVAPAAFSPAKGKTSTRLPVSSTPIIQGHDCLVLFASSTTVPKGRHEVELTGTEGIVSPAAAVSHWGGLWLLQVFRNGGDLGYQQSMAGVVG